MPIEINKERIRIRVKDPSLFIPESFRTVELSKEKGVSAVMGKLKSAPNGPMTIQVYLFDVKKWTLEKARQWVDEHKAAPCRMDCPQICQSATTPIGRAIGLAVRGEDEGILMPVTASIVPGKGEIIITGQLKEVMEESAKVAISLLKARTNQDMSQYDFHIHIPPGSLAKDGPSAGLAMFLALKSAWEKEPLPQYIAFTGEIDLNGNVRRVGGIQAKAEAAYLAGMGRMILPKDNQPDTDVILSEVKNLSFYLVETVDDALKIIMESSHRVAGPLTQSMDSKESGPLTQSMDSKKPKKEEEDMDRLAVIKAAGLEETASDEAVLAGITAMRQALEDKDKLLASGPKKEEIEKLQTRAAVLEKQLAAYGEMAKGKEEKEKKDQIETLISKGMKDGKIPPSAEAEWRACAEKDFDGTEKLLAASPPVVPLDRLNIRTEKGKKVSSSDSQSRINRMMGVSEETFAKYSAKEGGEN